MQNFRILMLEHDLNDIDLVRAELEKAFPYYTLRLVQTQQEFENALTNFQPDIILSEYFPLSLNGVNVFTVAQKITPHTPFILLTGTISEEHAVELIKNGITDYVLKDKLYSLTPRIMRALNEAEERNRKRNAEEALKESEANRRKSTSELIEINTALEAFSYSVSHDLRSPLRSVLSFSQIINKEYGHGLSSDVKELIGHIEISSKRMNNIIDDLLVLAKSAKDKLHMEQVNMNHLFSRIWDNILFTSPHHAVLEMPELPLVYADGSMLQQVVVNLLSNAVKYSSKKPEPQIRVGYQETDDSITFHVKDNGAGFDMKNYDLLFSAFQRLHGIVDFEGTGIGLVLVKRIIERHGGEVWAEGIVNEGATFYFSLPKMVVPGDLNGKEVKHTHS